MRTLHTFGDSHAGHLDGLNWRAIDIPDIRIDTHWIGAKCCATFGMEGLSLLNIKDFGVQEGDIVVFSFGEIDCRSHMYEYDNQYKYAINRIVSLYFNSIKDNVDQFQNITTIVFNVIPVARVNSINNNPDFPTIGSDKDRKKYVEHMNRLIEYHCRMNNYHFLDVYSEYSDEEGYLNENLSDGNVHIRDGRYIKDKLMAML